MKGSQRRTTRHSNYIPLVSKQGSGSRNAPVARFSSVMDGSTNTSVDPMACVPMTNIRQISRSGVDRLKSIFTSEGFTCGSDLGIVMKLSGAHRHHLSAYFKKQGLFASETKEKSESRNEWYGIIDGMHRHCALIELMADDSKTWSGFQWPVTLLSGGFPLLTLKQLARTQNAKHSETFYIEPTLYDLSLIHI